MKSVGIITFHAAHNYGSNLQAYALQKVIRKLGLRCEIINFRTPRQRDQYTPLTKRKGIKYIFKNLYFAINYRNRKTKYLKFESFIDKYLEKSFAEYKSLEELQEDPPKYDYYISGSDQIWNTVPLDADMAYFLPFVKNSRKIAYAPSFGQIGNIEHRDQIAEYINQYDCLSVREKFGQDLIKQMTGQTVPILIDPTMLLDKKEWEKIIPGKIVEGEYIFFYTLFADKQMIEIVKKISAFTGLKVVISNISNQYEILSGFEKKTASGPLEFLSLVKYSKLVCTTSFHGTVFSILLERPFLVINGMEDNRISTLLGMTAFTNRAVDAKSIVTVEKNIFNIDFTKSTKSIEKEKEKALNYLKEALEIEE